MEFLSHTLSFVLHIDTYLGMLFTGYGMFAYAALFLILFCETGLVVTPFLPGDSLLFTVGALAAGGHASLSLAWFVLVFGAILGDSTNYFVGRTAGEKIIRSKYRVLREEHVRKTNKFYSEWGGRTIVIGRFVPIVRTFAPFVAGLGQMHYARFLLFSVSGTILWVSLFVFGGYFFGGLPFVQNNFSAVILAVIVTSLVPGICEFLRAHYSKQKITQNEGAHI